MVTVNVRTDGKGVKQTYSQLSVHPTLGCEMAKFDFKIGDAEIRISFESWKEMIKFCEKHNFTYKDNREATLIQRDDNGNQAA